MADALRLGIQPENHCPLLHVVDNEYQTDLKITSDIKKNCAAVSSPGTIFTFHVVGTHLYSSFLNIEAFLLS